LGQTARWPICWCDRSSLDLADDTGAAGVDAPTYVAAQLASGELKLTVTEPDAERNWPRVLTAWRANLLGSSSKGNEYFLEHLLGTTGNVRAEPTSPEHRPRSVWFRSIFILQPDGEAMAEAPLSYQIHAIIALGLFALWSFTRLVHAFSAPVGYLFRPDIVYRSRAAPRPGEPIGSRPRRRGW